MKPDRMSVQRVVSSVILRCAIALLSMMCLVNTAFAQPQPVSALPEVLKGIKAADGVCRKNEPLSGEGEQTVSRENFPPDFSCALAVTDASTRLNQPDTLFADLRQAVEFSRFHIPGALSLNMSDLRSRPYWRDKDVILVGSGKAEHELYALCAELKKSGYKKVSVLRGGMPIWLNTAQPVSGRVPLGGVTLQLTAAEVWQESQLAENLVLLTQAYAGHQVDLPFAVPLKELDEQTVKRVVERRRKELKKGNLAAIVLAVDDTVSDVQINDLQQAMLPVPVMVYRGNGQVLGKAIAQQKAVWLAHERGPKQLGCGL